MMKRQIAYWRKCRVHRSAVRRSGSRRSGRKLRSGTGTDEGDRKRYPGSFFYPILVNPNAGLPRSENGKTVYDVDPKDFAAVMEEIVRMGAVITGGCCGTTPDHIHAMVELTKDIPVQMPEKKHRTVISSYSQAVVFDKKTIIIGERINPTGKSKFKQALRDHNLEYILREGVTQQDNGADVLDVNVGLPEIDEPSMMEDVVKELQAVIDLPLQLDTSSAEAMERGLRVYNGKPLINSVNGKKRLWNRSSRWLQNTAVLL